MAPDAGETTSHGDPPTDAVKVVPAFALIDTVCGAGDAPVAMAEKDSAVGVIVRLAAGFTLNVTGIVFVIPLPTSEMLPV